MLDTETETRTRTERAEWWFVPAFALVAAAAGTLAICLGWVSNRADTDTLGGLLVAVWAFIAMICFGFGSFFCFFAAGIAAKEVIEDH